MPDIHLPRILLVNNDGFDAAGLKTLMKVAANFTQEIWIVAPHEDQSGASQRVTLTHPVHTTKKGERKWEIKGTPSDCVIIALNHFMRDARPSLVLSGVNPRNNIGEKNNMSGTIGAAMTAMMLGVPSIAVSQGSCDNAPAPWDTTLEILPKVLSVLLKEGWRRETCLSVNIPALPAEEIRGMSWARQVHKHVGNVNAFRRISPHQEEYFWLSLETRDCAPMPHGESLILQRGEVAITPLTSDRSIDIAKPTFLFQTQSQETEARFTGKAANG